MQAMTPMTPLQAGVEMFQRAKLQPFFAPRSDKARPVSEAVTEIFDTDFEDDSSEFDEPSPKYSFGSSDSRRSQTTISTYDEVPTPHSSRRMHFHLQTQDMKPVEGPKGPHLFRSSQASAEFALDFALQLSPLVPKQSPARSETAFRVPPEHEPVYEVQPPYQDDSFAEEDYLVQDVLDDVSLWTAQHVAAWMCRLGFEDSIIAKFEQHDITGAVLLDMQFEDLKELEISSFGKRHQLWNHIDALRGNDGHISPAPTPFQDVSRPCTRMDRSNSVRDSSRSRHQRAECEDSHDGSFTPITPGGGRKRRGRKHRTPGDDIITPAESVSIVAIEQLLPKPHRCAKGERCNKWKKQQRQLQRLQEEHGFPISPENGGQIFIAGDPGNASTAPNLVQSPFRPTSDAMPSVVASSDLLGPGQLPDFTLDEEKLRDIESRDPQENVKQFLTLQHVEPSQMFPTPVNRPSTPPLEMFPPLQPPLHPPEHTQPPVANLRSLPKLNIPRSASANPYGNHAQPSYHVDNTFSPCRSAVASPGVYRFGTPASEMDVPVTAINLGPVSRDTSQSVPPSMQFRDPVERTTSRNDWRRPSFMLPALSEGQVFSPNSSDDSITLHSASSNPTNPTATKSHLLHRHHLQTSNAPPSQQQQQERYPGTNHAGWMKKRKTRLLRHEWQTQHFRLTGTRLAMHATDQPNSTALGTFNIDDYAVACSSLASNKLAAKLKALKLSSRESEGAAGAATGGAGSDKIDGAAAFSFQLVPVAGDGPGKGIVARKVVGGKTHHFAVKTRDERIDWMRELMLAKALKAKGEGYEVQVNGSAI